MKNPFEYGRELEPHELVDREEEVAAVIGTIRDAGKLFLIGPRRYGKTSILQVAAARAAAELDAIVLRYDAEAYPRLDLLAQRIVADATKALVGFVERAGEHAARLFGRLRPQFTINAHDGTFSATFNVAPADRAGDLPLITDALDGVERLARGAKRPVAIVIDEVQRLVADGGRDAEGQLRSVMQRHKAVGYVLAGSNTRLLAAMTTDPSRPFYNMGQRWFIGAVPRPDFERFLSRGFRSVRPTFDASAITRILDLAEDVPYNVQMLAHECWEQLQRTPRTRRTLTARQVTAAAERLARRLDSLYSQWWLQLTAPQQLALSAFVLEPDGALFSGEVTARYGLTASSMQKAIEALQEKTILREEATLGVKRLRLGDPFFGIWVRLVTGVPDDAKSKVSNG